MNWLDVEAAKPKDPLSKLGPVKKPAGPKLGEETGRMLQYLAEAILKKEQEFVEARKQYVGKYDFRQMTPDQIAKFGEIGKKKSEVDATIAEIHPQMQVVETFLRTLDGLTPEQRRVQKVPPEVDTARDKTYPLVDVLAKHVDEFVSLVNAFSTNAPVGVSAADDLSLYRKIRKPVGEASFVQREVGWTPADKNTLEILSAQSRMFHWALRTLDELKSSSTTLREKVERSPKTTEMRWELAQLQDRIDREIPKHLLDEVDDVEETLKEAIRIDMRLGQPLSPETTQLIQEYMTMTEDVIGIARDAEKLLSAPVSGPRTQPGQPEELIPEAWKERVNPKPGQIGWEEVKDIERSLSSFRLAYTAAHISLRLGVLA